MARAQRRGLGAALALLAALVLSTGPAAAQPARAPVRPQPAPRPAALPPVPSQADVMAAADAVRGEVEACVRPRVGLAVVRVLFENTGRALIAHITSAPWRDRAVLRCITDAARRARVPPFRRRVAAVMVPFVVRPHAQ